jgi:hypothetical protein
MPQTLKFGVFDHMHTTASLIDLCIEEWVTLNWILKKYEKKGVDWIHVALVRDKWRALVDTVTNVRVP